MQQYNKTTVATLAGAVVTIIGVFAPELMKDSSVQGALQTVLTAALVYFVPNKV